MCLDANCKDPECDKRLPTEVEPPLPEIAECETCEGTGEIVRPGRERYMDCLSNVDLDTCPDCGGEGQ